MKKKNKIAIITVPLGDNYGGILQNWALQNVIKQMGAEPLTLRQRPIALWWQLYYQLQGHLIYHLKKLIHHPTRNIEIRANVIRNRFRHLEQFVENHIASTPLKNRISEKYLRSLGISKCIVGSDQIWRPKCNLTQKYLMFASFISVNGEIERNAYAASFGVDHWEFSPSETKDAANNIQFFNTVTVREESGVELCQRHLKHNAKHVLDPTLLLQAKDYSQLIDEEILSKIPKKKYAAIYILDKESYDKSAVERFCMNHALIPLYMMNHNEPMSELSPIGQWLASIMNAEIVITDSFHGMAFSINFRKPFISISNHGRGGDRFTSLANQFDVKGRLIDSCSYRALQSAVEESIDWENIEKLMTIWRRISLQELKKMI